MFQPSRSVSNSTSSPDTSWPPKLNLFLTATPLCSSADTPTSVNGLNTLSTIHQERRSTAQLPKVSQY